MATSTGVANGDLGNIAQYIQRLLDFASPGIVQGGNMISQFTNPDANSPFVAGGGFDYAPIQQALKNFQQNGMTLPPALQAIMDGASKGAGSAQDIINSGGVTSDTSAASNALKAILAGSDPNSMKMSDLAGSLTKNGGFTGAMSDAHQQALNLIKSGGWTPQSQQGADAFMNIINQGGQTDQTNSMFSQGQNLVSNNGMTPQMTQLLNVIMPQIQNQGMTTSSTQLMNSLMGIINGTSNGALLPMQNAVSSARDQAAAATANASEAARRNAFQRLGDASGAGTSEQSLAEFGDQAARNEASTVQTAVKDQQGLQLQQLLGAIQGATGVNSTASSLLASLTGQAGDISKTAAGNISTGSDLEKNAAGIASSNLGTATSGYNDILKQVATMLGTGSDLFKSTNALAQNNVSQGSDLLKSLLAGQTTAANGLTNVAQTQNSAVSDAMKNLANLLGVGSSTYNSAADDWLKSISQSSSNINDFTKNWLTGAQTNIGAGSAYLSALPSLFGAYGGVSGSQVANANTPGFWSNIANSVVGGLAGGLTGGLGGAISGIGRSKP
jgi:hypothetical protein